jgi:hypothetical protein
MKKIITLFSLFILTGSIAFAQYFQSTMTNQSNKVSVKLRPTATMTTAIGFVEFYIRYNTASTPAFTIGNVTPNVTNFPGLSFGLGAGFTDGAYTYKNFVATVTVPSATYTGGTEYELVTFTLDGAPAVADIELASDFALGTYYFAINDGGGLQIDPGSNPQFYGPGYNTSGTGHFLPLIGVPVPVKFLGFDAVKKNNTAVLNWTVENENANTDKYIIERSANSIDFTPVASIAALNNGRGSNTYSFTQDNLSAIRSTGVIYFRIKQVDKDGKSIVTPIKNVRLDGKAFAVNAYPNPVRNITKLTIDLVEAADIVITVADATGKQVKAIQMQGFKGTNFRDVNLTDLSSGNYLMNVRAGNELKAISLVKVN